MDFIAGGSSEGMNLSLFAEISLVVVTFLLVVVTAGLWIATAKLHKDELAKMTDAMSHDNDNMTMVARDAIREERRRNLRRLQSARHHVN